MRLARLVLRSLRRDPHAYLGLFGNLVLSIAVLFAYASLVFHKDALLDPFSGDMGLLFPVIFGILLAAALLAVCSSLRLLYKQRALYLGILRLLGITGGQLRSLLAWETALVGGCAVVCGLLLGFIFHLLLLGAMRYLVGMSALKLAFSWPALSVALAASGLILLGVSLAAPYLVRERRILVLLQGERRAEAFPATSRWLAVLSVGSLGGMLVLCLLGERDSWLALLTSCLLLALLGLYFFYTQIIILLVQRARAARSFAWRAGRLLWLGSLAHRLRANARLFYFLTLALLVGWLAAGTLFLAHPTDRSLHEKMEQGRYQVGFGTYQAVYETSRAESETPIPSARQRLFEEKLARELGPAAPALQRIEYFSLEAPVRGRGCCGCAGVEVLSAAEYHKLQARKGGPRLMVGPDELVLLRKSYANPLYQHLLLSPAALAGLRPSQESVYEVEEAVTLPHRLWVVGERLLSAWEAKRRSLEEQQFTVRKMSGYLFPAQQLGFVQLRNLGTMSREFYRNSQHPDEGGAELTPLNHFLDRWVRELFFVTTLVIALTFSLIVKNFLILRIYNDLRRMAQSFRVLQGLGVSVAELRRTLTCQMAIFFFLPVVVAGAVVGCLLLYIARLLPPFLLPMQDLVVGSLGPAMAPALLLGIFLLGVEGLLFLLLRHQLLRTLLL